MARTTIKITYKDFNTAKAQVENLLTMNKYKQITQNGETVWKCGVGFLTAIKYIKVEFAENNVLLLSGWIRAVLGSESALTGVFGAVPKKQVLKLMQDIQALITA